MVVHVKYKIFSTFTHIHSAHLFTQYAFISISFSYIPIAFAFKRLCSISSLRFHLGTLNSNEGTNMVQHHCRSTTLQAVATPPQLHSCGGVDASHYCVPKFCTCWSQVIGWTAQEKAIKSKEDFFKTYYKYERDAASYKYLSQIRGQYICLVQKHCNNILGESCLT